MDPDLDEIAGDLIDTFKSAALDRMMHEDGCPEGEQIRAGIAAIANVLYHAALNAAWEQVEKAEAKCAALIEENRTLLAGAAIDDALRTTTNEAFGRGRQSAFQDALDIINEIEIDAAAAGKAGRLHQAIEAIRALKVEGANG